MLEVAVLYGCDLSQVFTPIILRLYQPHSLCEKGATKAAAKAALYVFLLAPLHEGRRGLRLQPPGAGLHFYSRPYTRGDFGRGTSPQRARPISTRAPTRGATLCQMPSLAAGDISTRAPTRGATRLAEVYIYPRKISTRAPTRGATPRRSGRVAPHGHFYSRPYTRGDSNFSQNHKLIYMINC